MDHPAESFLKHLSCPAVHLSKMRVENFGNIVDKTFEFHQGVNLIADVERRFDPNAEAEGKPIVQAIKILLGSAWHQNEVDEDSFKFLPGPQGESQSRITGYFRERDRESDSGGLQFTLCVSKSDGRLLFSVDGSPRRFPEVRSLFADHRLHKATVIYLSQTMIFCDRFLPVSFFWDELHRAETLNTIEKNSVVLESESYLSEAMGLMKYLEIAGKRVQDKVKRLADPYSENFDLLEQRDQLSSLAKYTKIKKLHDRADELRKKIEDQRAHIQIEERLEHQKRAAQMEKQMARLLLDLGPSDEPSAAESSKKTLEESLNQLKRELDEKRQALSSLGPVVENLEQLRAEEQQLATNLEETKSRLLLLQKSLVNVEAEKRRVVARLQAIRGLGGECMKLASDTLILRICRLEKEYMNANSYQCSLDDEPSRKRARLEEISEEENEIVKRLEAREERLFELIRDEVIKEHVTKRNTDALSSGSVYENLAAQINETLNRNHLKVIEAMTSILRKFNVEPKESEWRQFGYFGAVIDHIHVEPQLRGMLRPIRKLLATFLVRDEKVAWMLREEIQKLKFEDRVNFICFEGYDRTPREVNAPRGTKPLSPYLNTQVMHRYHLTPEEVEKLDRILACELENYFAIEGDPTQASNLAKSIAKLPQWASCTFVIQDGTCFGRNAERYCGESGDPLTPYKLLWDYWEVKQSELKSRFDQVMQARKERHEAEEEIRAFLEETREKLREIDKLRTDIRFHEMAKRNLEGEKAIISSQIDKYTQQATVLQATEGSGIPNAYELELESLLKYMDTEIAQLSDEIHSLDDSISKSIAGMVETYVRYVSCEVKDQKVLELEAGISWIETQIKKTESFLEQCGEFEMGIEEEPVNQVARTDPWCAPDTPLYQSRTFLLEQKLSDIRKKLRDIEAEVPLEHWDPNTDFAQQLRISERQARRQNILPMTETLVSTLQGFSKKDPWIGKRMEVPEELLEEVFDVSQESSFLSSLEQDTLKFVLELFEKTVLESYFGSQVRILSFHGSITSADEGRDLRSDARILKRDLVEVVFDGVPTEVGGTLSDREKSLLLISALIARKALHAPRVLLVDESDFSLSSLPYSQQSKFFEEFVPECQMFILSQDTYLRMHPVHHLIGFTRAPNESFYITIASGPRGVSLSHPSPVTP